MKINVALNLSLPMVLFAIFLVLKLTGVIAWSWWWITAPLWGPVALTLLLVSIFLVVRAVRRKIHGRF